MGTPTFCFSFTSDEFDIYHVNDLMRRTRLALQRPAVPERDPHGGDPAADAARRRRGVRGGPRRGRRVRAAKHAAGEAPLSRRPVRRRGRWVGSPPRSRSSSRGDDRHAGHPAEPAAGDRVTGDADRFVLAVDQGTGGPKVGLVTTRGEIVWWGHDRATTYGDASATQDAEEWWRLVVDAATRGQAEAGVSGEEVVAVGVTGQWASTVPVDADGPAGRPVPPVDRHPGAPYSKAVVGGPVQGYDPRRSPPGCAAPPGSRPTAATRSGTCCTCSTTVPRSRPGAVVPRAGRLPLHAVHRRRRRLAHVDDGGLAHRQPPARRPRLRPQAGAAGRCRRRQAAAAGARRGR